MIKRIKAVRDRIVRDMMKSKYARKMIHKHVLSRFREVMIQHGRGWILVDPNETFGRYLIENPDAISGVVRMAINILVEDGHQLSGKLALDVGANIGSETITLASEFLFRGVVAFEPENKNLDLLRRNVSLNGLDSTISIVPAAVGERKGSAVLNINEINRGANSLAWTNGASNSTVVPVVSIDEYLRENKLSEEDIGFVWMDIEGFEPAALRGMSSLLSRRVPIALEWSPLIMSREDAIAARDLIAQCYERVYCFDGDRYERIPAERLPLNPVQIEILLA